MSLNYGRIYPIISLGKLRRGGKGGTSCEGHGVNYVALYI